MANIILTNGSVVLVDDEDFEILSKRSWHMTSNGYAAATISGMTTRMHRYVLGLTREDHRLVDHANRNRLDNRKANLRICSKSQNSMNAKTHADSISGLKGVSWVARRNKWMPRISVGGKQKSLGLYETAEEAHEVYCLWADMLYGEFSNHGKHQ